ncbi:MAG: response regulator [Haloarculaceae archaeon]
MSGQFELADEGLVRMSVPIESIRVLHVEDDPGVAEVTTSFLEQESDAIEVVTASDASEGLEMLDRGGIDCVVSDYEMPGRDGIEFLEAVRAEHEELPFILFTGRGSEEVASDAISAGVTDYLQKETGTDQYAVLANRVENAVESYRARHELDARKSRLETLISNLPGVVYRCRNEPAWPMEFVEGECAALTGYPASTIESGDVEWGEDVVHPDDRDRVWETVQESVDAGDPFELTYRILTADGEQRCVWERGRLAANGDGESALEGFITDVTDQHRRTTELARYERMVDSMLESACIYDEEGRFAVVNDYLADWYGTTPSDLVGQKSQMIPMIRDQTPGDGDPFRQLVAGDRDEIRGEVEGEFDGYGRAVLDYRLTRLTVDGEFDGVVGVTREITERRDRERALRALHDVAFDLDADDAVDDACHRTVDAAERVLSFDRASVAIGSDGGLDVRATTAPRASGETAADGSGTGRSPGRAAPDGAAPVERLAEVAYRTGRSLVGEGSDRPDDRAPFESVLAVPVGNRGVFQAVSTEPDAFDDVDVELAELLVNQTRNALDRIDRERDLERQNERLETFVRIVSHDLRNPLEVAGGRLQIVAEECDSDQLDTVVRAHERMETIVDEMMALAQDGETAAEVEPVPVGAVAEDAWGAVRTGDARLSVSVQRTVRANRSRLQQLFENLFRNAVEHGSTSPDSHARQDAVEHGSTSPERRGSDTGRDADESGYEPLTVTVGGLDDGFFVADDGCGIAEEDRDRVFEDGFSTSHDGTGFGLSIVRQVADGHGWDVSVTESRDGGARFEVTGVGSE